MTGFSPSGTRGTPLRRYSTTKACIHTLFERAAGQFPDKTAWSAAISG